MRKLSLSARKNPATARLIIILSFIIVTLLAVFTGTLLRSAGISIPPYYLGIVIVVYLLTVLVYPRKIYGVMFTLKWNYTNRKISDGFLALSTYLMLLILSNNDFSQINYIQSAVAAPTSVLPGDSTVKKYQTIREFSKSMKDEDGNQLKWKQKKKLLKEQVKAIRKADDLSRGNKTLLIIVSVLVALGLLVLLTGLACNLSCNGSEAAAIILGVGGAALVVFLLIVVLRSIDRKYRKSREKPVEPPAM